MKNPINRFLFLIVILLGLNLLQGEVHAQATVSDWITTQDVLVDGPVAVDRLLQAANSVSGGGMEDDANNSGIDGLPLFYRTVAAEIRDNNLTARESINKTAAVFLSNGAAPQTVGALVASIKMILS